jgi:protection of telomeres protein 1
MNKVAISMLVYQLLTDKCAAVKCENIGTQISEVSSLLSPVLYHTNVDGEHFEIKLPFTCAKYRTAVRVIDYHPQKLEDFAYWRKKSATEFSILSDYSGSGSEDQEENLDDETDPTSSQYSGEKTWEWRFALRLEDASSNAKQAKSSFWVVVNNLDAQLLTGRNATE